MLGASSNGNQSNNCITCSIEGIHLHYLSVLLHINAPACAFRSSSSTDLAALPGRRHGGQSFQLLCSVFERLILCAFLNPVQNNMSFKEQTEHFFNLTLINGDFILCDIILLTLICLNNMLEFRFVCACVCVYVRLCASQLQQR